LGGSDLEVGLSMAGSISLGDVQSNEVQRLEFASKFALETPSNRP
jgi:hypothetical protein